jgi:macrolide transport system ATP-binding/permease protein
VRRVRALFVRLAGLVGRERRDRELADELASHLELHADENIRAGLSAHEARRQALIRLGGVEATKELYRERRGLPLLETLCQDLRFAARGLRKNISFTTRWAGNTGGTKIRWEKCCEWAARDFLP